MYFTPDGEGMELKDRVKSHLAKRKRWWKSSSKYSKRRQECYGVIINSHYSHSSHYSQYSRLGRESIECLG